MSFLVAVQLLTSIPVPVKKEIGPDGLGRATAWFPVVGLIIGLVLAGVYWVLDLVLPPALASAILVALLVGLTGGIHLDGLADTCDGMAGYRPAEERWKIMHDSRTGAFGVVGIVLVLLGKYAALSCIPDNWFYPSLVLMPVLSRWAMVYAIFAFRYAHKEGMGAAYKQATRLPQFLAATILTLAACGGSTPFMGWAGFAAFGEVLLLSTVMAFYFRSKLKGLTGDTYGAINEISEIGALAMVIIVF